MLAIEQRKPRRKDIKTLEKDIKILTGIFTDRRLFIKVHMIYKKFIAVTPGSVFFAIANFYNVLQTTNGCQKLLKNTLRVCLMCSFLLSFVSCLLSFVTCLLSLVACVISFFISLFVLFVCLFICTVCGLQGRTGHDTKHVQSTRGGDRFT